MEQENDLPAESLIITDDIKNYLIETAKWSKFLSIVGFMGLGLMILIAVFTMSSGAMREMGMIGLLYFAIAGLYFIPLYFLIKSSSHIDSGIRLNDQPLVTSGFQYLKSHFKFMGILVSIIIAIYALIILFSIIMLAVAH